MAGVYKLDIQESENDLKQLLRQQKTASGKERIQLLYLLKTGQAKTVQAAATQPKSSHALLSGCDTSGKEDWLGCGSTKPVPVVLVPFLPGQKPRCKNAYRKCKALMGIKDVTGWRVS